jgi:hypothetical protein
MFSRITILILLLCNLPPCAIAGTVQLPKTGQTTSYAAGDDGDLERGVAWPSPRFTVSGDCVTDNLTGLMWTKNGNMLGAGGFLTWQGALDYVATTVNSGAGTCGHSDWRLPNVIELESLVNAGQANSADWLNGQGFANVQADWYWSSSTYAGSTDHAWIVVIWGGYVNFIGKYDYYSVWPVRAGQSGSLPTAWIVGTSSYFNTLQGAHDSAVDGNTIEAEAAVFPPGGLTVSKSLTLKGGYDSSFASNSGYTTLQGILTIQSGSLTVENLIIM